MASNQMFVGCPIRKKPGQILFGLNRNMRSLHIHYMVEVVRLSAGAERTTAREHLIGLFDLVGDDPRVANARVALANALF